MSDKARVRVYTTNHCGFCRSAKRLLEQRGVAYESIDLSDDLAQREALVERTGWRTVPVIEIDGELIGGFNELMRYDRETGFEDF